MLVIYNSQNNLEVNVAQEGTRPAFVVFFTEFKLMAGTALFPAALIKTSDAACKSGDILEQQALSIPLLERYSMVSEKWLLNNNR